MYRKPGYFEIEDGKAIVDACSRLIGKPPKGKRVEDLTADLFRSLSKNLNRRVRMLSLDEVLTIHSDDAPHGSSYQRDFAHVFTRFLFHLKVVDRYPAFVDYSPIPHISIDDCVDKLIGKRIVWPTSLSELGSPDVALDAAAPPFLLFLRKTASLARLRASFVDKLRVYVSHIGWKIASGEQFEDQFERSFFTAFCDTSSLYGSSNYSANPRMPCAQNADVTVAEFYRELKPLVEAGPYLRFGVLISNKHFQELFAFFGPYVPTLNFGMGYLIKRGDFVEPIQESQTGVPWSMELQEDAMRAQAAHILPSVSSLLTIAQPLVMFTGRTVGAMTSALGPQLDLPDVLVDMSRGFDSETHEWRASWYSPTRGRLVASESGANGTILLQDLALQNARLGEAAVGVTDITHWKLLDPNSLTQLKISEEAFDKEEIAHASPAGNGVATTKVDMKPFYSGRGNLMYRPAFSEYFEPHLNMLREADAEAESYIARACNLSDMQRRISEKMVRMSHQWHRLKRLFGVEIIPWDDLIEMMRLENFGTAVSAPNVGALTQS